MTPKILIAENDLALQKMLKNYLSKKYDCVSSGTIDQTLKILEKDKIELIVLDRLLDDGDSISILDYLDEVFFRTKVICLSHKDKVADRVEGLKAGADDYLPKPFAINELLIRIERLLQKEKIQNSNVITFNNIKLFPHKAVVEINKKTIFLRRRESQLLSCLMIHRGQVVSRKTLIKYIWSGEDYIPEQSTLDVYVRRLRIALGKYGELVVTVRGLGYLIKPAVVISSSP